MAEPIAIEGGVVATSKCENSSGNRKEKRKVAKKEKRKQLRKELAEKARQSEEARLNDPEEQRRIQLEEERERERLERERKEFEERERLFLEALARKRAEEEEDERRRALEEELKKNQAGQENEQNEDDDWEYVEEGPPEIIWQGNEIIVKKNRVKVKKKDSDLHSRKEGADRPTSNPLPPQSEAFGDYQNAPALSAQQLLENVAQQVPNFGTEQDKAHCPFHLKTGACRFGSRCSRVHFYPNKSSTLLMKNMYNGPGLAWEQDEGLEYTDEEVEGNYEEFYEDVHTEFLKYGEIVNFKVCRNGAFHLRGNLYVHYHSLDSAVMAYHSMNGRYFAGKQVNCEFVGVTRWKIAICGEYMKSRLKTCSRGSACNFIHCFRNPGGDYEWADWDKPPPRFWMKKMNALFGNSKDLKYDKEMEEESPGKLRNSNWQIPADRHRYHSRRSRSREKDSFNERSSKRHYEDRDLRKSTDRHSDSRKRQRTCEESNSRGHQHKNNKTSDTDSGGDYLDIESNAETFHEITRKSSRGHRSEVPDLREYRGGYTNKTYETESDGDLSDSDTVRDRQHDVKRKNSTHKKLLSGLHVDHHYDRTRDKDKNWSDQDTHKQKNHARRTSNSRGNHHAKSTDYKEYKDESSSGAHETIYDGDLLDTDRKRERRRCHKKNSSTVSLDDFDDKRNESHFTDFDGEWSHEGKDSRTQRKDSKSRKGVSDIHESSSYKKRRTHSADTHSILVEEERYRPEECTEEDRYRTEV